MNKFNSRFNPASQLARSVYIAVAMVLSIALGVKASTAPHNDIPSTNSIVAIDQPVVTTKTETTTEYIPYNSSTVFDSSRTSGSVLVTTIGINGVKTVTWIVSLSDGVESRRAKVSDEVTTQPVNEVITKGTYVAPVYCPNGTYVNTYGSRVCSPYSSPTTPSGASAICRDGTYSFSQSRSGTCSHHGGVSQWL